MSICDTLYIYKDLNSLPRYHNLGALATTNPVHAVAATPLGLTHSSNVGLCTNFVGAAVPC